MSKPCVAIRADLEDFLTVVEGVAVEGGYLGSAELRRVSDHDEQDDEVDEKKKWSYENHIHESTAMHSTFEALNLLQLHVFAAVGEARGTIDVDVALLFGRSHWCFSVIIFQFFFNTYTDVQVLNDLTFVGNSSAPTIQSF